MAVAKLVFVLVVSMMSVGAVGQTMCSYEELMQAYKGDNKQKIRQCRELHERYGPRESEKPKKPAKTKPKTSSSAACIDSARLRAAKRDVTSYRSEIADLNSEKRRLDRRLREFDDRYERSKPSRMDALQDLLAAGSRGGTGAVGTRGAQQRQEAAERARIYEDERFELQNRISDMKRQLNREIRDLQRYVADAEDRVERLRASECQ